VATRCKALVCDRSLAGIVGLNLAVGSECLLCVLCVVRQRSLRRAEHSSRGVLLSVARLSVIVKTRKGSPRSATKKLNTDL
jgi:hypothetical protein